MKNQFFLLAASIFIGITLCSFKGQEATTMGGWELLGSREVTFRMDKDEIMVTGKEGTFKAIQLRVKMSAINMHRLTIHFADGSEQEVELKNNFKAGDESRVIDLEGNNRIIRKISLWYDTKNARNKRALVQVWGKH